MPSTIDISTRARDWACENQRTRIAAFIKKNQIEHLLTSRILEPMNIVSVARAELHELKAISHMMQTLTLYK